MTRASIARLDWGGLTSETPFEVQDLPPDASGELRVALAGDHVEATASAGQPNAALDALNVALALSAVDKVTWELEETSREPGVAMNFPVDAPSDPGFDLRLNPGGGTPVVLHDDKQEGTGVNDPMHVLQSRYGPASEGRGTCRSQLPVSDRVTAPTR